MKKRGYFLLAGGIVLIVMILVYSTYIFQLENTEEYIACGCGCCPGDTEIPVTCLYYSEGDRIGRIILEDRLAARSPQCPMMGCNIPIKYAYCD